MKALIGILVTVCASAICQFAWADRASTAAQCDETILSGADRAHISTIIKEFAGDEIQLRETDSSTLPTFLVDGPQDGYQLVYTLGFDWPYAVKIPDEKANVWKTLSRSQRLFLLGELEKIFQQNSPKSKMNDSAIYELMKKRLGLNQADINREVTRRTRELDQNELAKTSLFLPKIFRSFLAFIRTARRLPGSHVGVLRDTLAASLAGLTPEEQKKIRGISARGLFGLAYQKADCVGVCRHASGQLAAILMELGVPASNVHIGAGFFILPVTGHAWNRVKITDSEWKIYDPTPLGRSGILSIALQPLSALIVNFIKRFYPQIFPNLSGLTGPSLSVPFWTIESNEPETDNKTD